MSLFTVVAPPLRLLVLPVLLLTACAAPQRAPEPPPVVVQLPPPPPPEDPLGVPTHRFEFDPAMTDVVGTLQSTVVGKEDALPDIARRFNLGYEEIVRANPGVDPWLPGEGRRVLLPTRFVLPDAPRIIFFFIFTLKLFFLCCRNFSPLIFQIKRLIIINNNSFVFMSAIHSFFKLKNI